MCRAWAKPRWPRRSPGLVDAKFSRIQFTPDLLPADITGTSIYNPSTGQFQFRPGPVFTNILLADEINRASPRTQSALLECMCEHQVSPDGQSRILEAPFMVIATQNPIEYQGTYPLPEAQLDRFAMRLTLGYPDEEAEREMLYDRRHIDPLESLKPEISCQEVLDLQADMKKVGMEASVSAYLLTIVQSTRRDARLTLGASPRAAIRLADCSRSLALISGREFVLPDDVRELAPLVLSHRLVVDAKTRYAGVSAQEIVAEIVQSVKVPL
ncbi:MAG: MoxR family ATPase [Victivallis sp.]